MKGWNDQRSFNSCSSPFNFSLSFVFIRVHPWFKFFSAPVRVPTTAEQCSSCAGR